MVLFLLLAKKAISHYHIYEKLNKKRCIMKSVIYKSDYSDAILKIVQTDDGDIVLKISHPGEMRIATQGGKLHGDALVSVINSFKNIINVLEKEGENNDRK